MLAYQVFLIHVIFLYFFNLWKQDTCIFFSTLKQLYGKIFFTGKKESQLLSHNPRVAKHSVSIYRQTIALPEKGKTKFF